MQFRPSKRQLRKRRPKPLANTDDVQPLTEPAPCRELLRLTLYNPRTGTNCVIVPYPGSRPGRLRVMVNGKPQPAIATTTELMDWLRRMMQAWADYLDELEQRASGQNVVSMGHRSA